MPNNYLSVLYQHIIQVENKNVGLKVEGHKHTIAPPSQKSGGHMCQFIEIVHNIINWYMKNAK